MLEIKALLISVLPYIPFVSAAVIKNPEGNSGGVGVVITRLVEAGIIGAMILYANLQVLEQKFTDIKEDITTCELSEQKLQNTMDNLRVELKVLAARVEDLRTDHERAPRSRN